MDQHVPCSPKGTGDYRFNWGGSMAYRIVTLRRAASSAAVAAALALSGPVLAQDEATPPDAADEAAGETNVITVTAQFREQNLQDTPIAITAMTGEMIEARGQTNLAEIGASAPNVTLR